jgi:peptide chain release factor
VRFFTEDDLSEFLGSVQWTCRSPYRPEHKRKNWFIDFSACATVKTDKFDPEQVVLTTFRSGGKGGQNVNKVETGVRAIYLLTGQAVVCTEERSQYANKQKALNRLQELVKQKNQQKEADAKNDNWRCHTSLQRGNAGVWFEGTEFRKI